MQPADYRVHRNAAATLIWQPVDSEGELEAAAGTPTVSIVRASGATLTPDASPAIVGDAVNLTLTAAELADVDRLTVTWSLDDDERGVSTVDVVGGVYLTVADIRQFEPALSDPSEFLPTTLQRCRREVEARFERAVPGVAFVPRLSVARFTGEGGGRVVLSDRFPSEVRWARYWSSGTWSDLDVSSAIFDSLGTVELAVRFPYGYPAEVGYVHGMTSPTEDVKRAAALAVRYQALQSRSGIDSRAMSYQPAEGGNVVLATAGVGPWEFGVPDIDGVLRSWRDRYMAPQVA